MSKGIILVDYNNAFYGRIEAEAYVKSKIEEFLEECTSVAESIDSIDIRLYGGWMSNSSYTNSASKVLGIIEALKSSIFPIPFKGTRLYGDISLVISQHNLDIKWDNTFQEKRAKHSLKVCDDMSQMCCSDNEESCPLQIIAKATCGKEVVCPVNGKNYVNASNLIRMEQKMVDSMMSCDILEYIKDEECEVLEVVSNDIDLHPALALAGAKYALANNVSLLLLLNNRRSKNACEQLLSVHNIKVKLWQ